LPAVEDDIIAVIKSAGNQEKSKKIAIKFDFLLSSK
jgi:hypothetical protein